MNTEQTINKEAAEAGWTVQHVKQFAPVSTHAPEPWSIRENPEGGVIFGTITSWEIGGDGERVGVGLICKEGSARRIVAAINACAGMQDPEKEIAELRAQRDELLAALKQAAGELISKSEGRAA